MKVENKYWKKRPIHNKLSYILCHFLSPRLIGFLLIVRLVNYHDNLDDLHDISLNNFKMYTDILDITFYYGSL